jgi:hypothetical protein
MIIIVITTTPTSADITLMAGISMPLFMSLQSGPGQSEFFADVAGSVVGGIHVSLGVLPTVQVDVSASAIPLMTPCPLGKKGVVMANRNIIVIPAKVTLLSHNGVRLYFCKLMWYILNYYNSFAFC